jgi:hypothetical protein
MARIDEIQAIIAKGDALTAADVREIEFLLTQMPLDEQHEAVPWVWEAVALIVDDLTYTGDARVPTYS